jgi:flagellar biosynthesis/type III secretory pathway chaperone
MTPLNELAEFNQTQFSSQIDALNQLLLDFQALLKSESDLLTQSDLEHLSEIVEKKAELGQKIETASLELDKHFDKLDSENTFFSLAQGKAFASISEELQNKVDQVLAQSQACNDLNLSNGITIQILSNINQVSINLLRQQPESDVNLYNSTGESKKVKGSSSLGKA